MDKSRKWSPEKTALDNILYLYTLLLFNKYKKKYSLNELVEKLNVSKPTVLRYLDALEVNNFCQVRREVVKRELYVWVKRPKELPQICLSPTGLEQLALCRDFMCHLLPDSMRRQTDAFLGQATAFLPSDGGGEAEPSEDSLGDLLDNSLLLAQTFTKGRINYTPYQDTLKTIIRAIRQNRVCVISNQATGVISEQENPPTSFAYAPKRLVSFHEAIHIQGWKVDEADPPGKLKRNFTDLLLHRIKKIELTDRQAEHLPLPPPQTEKNSGAFGYMDDGQVFEAKIEFSSKVAMYVAEREWSEDQEVVENPDGSIILTLAVRSALELRSWVLGFGGQAQALSPTWFVRDLQNEIKQLKKVYEQ